MTEVPEHLRKRAAEARARAEAGGTTIPPHLLQRARDRRVALGLGPDSQPTNSDTRTPAGREPQPEADAPTGTPLSGDEPVEDVDDADEATAASAEPLDDASSEWSDIVRSLTVLIGLGRERALAEVLAAQADLEVLEARHAQLRAEMDAMEVMLDAQRRIIAQQRAKTALTSSSWSRRLLELLEE